MKESEREQRRERRILLHFLGISLSYIIMVGGFLVFILLVLKVSPYLLGGFFSAYLTLALATTMTFLHTPIKNLGLRKYFTVGALIFLIIAGTLLTQWMIGI